MQKEKSGLDEKRAEQSNATKGGTKQPKTNKKKEDKVEEDAIFFIFQRIISGHLGPGDVL